MKWKTIAEDYFTFSRPQRRSIIITIAIIVTCLGIRFGYSYFFATQSVPVDATFLQEAEQLTRQDTTQKNHQYPRRNYSNDDEAIYKEPYKNYPSNSYATKSELFAFDPNTLNTEGWLKLGLRDKTIATIQNYLLKGGHFRKPEDIKRIYGLFPDQAERLLPYVRIADTEPVSNNYVKKEYTKNEPASTTYPSKLIAPSTIDINMADTTAFISLPGIGSKLANRIVGFRDKLGGFYSVEQVGETYGLPDSVFQKIKSKLIVGDSPVKKIDINTADATTLKANPYIKWNIANAIVQYRTQHGNYTTLMDLKKIAIIDEQLWAKIQAYLVVQ